MPKENRRAFIKKSATLAGAGALGAFAMGGIDRSVLAAPPASSISQINQWMGMVPAATCIIWVDASNNYYVKDAGVGSQLGALIVNASLITAYGASLGAGTAGAQTTTAGIQEALNCMTSSGVVFIKNGIYTVSTPITIPNALSFRIIGSGIPSFQQDSTGGTTFNTPSDGTQIRGTAAGFNNITGWPGNKVGIFQNATSGIHAGTLVFRDLAIMPAWGNTSGGTNVYAIKVDGTSIGPLYVKFEGHMLFAPWGWSEVGQPVPTSSQKLVSARLSLAGNGTVIDIEYMDVIGMCENTASIPSIFNADYVSISRLFLFRCPQGPTAQAADGVDIRELAGFDVPGTYITLTHSSATGGVLNHIGKIFMEGTGFPSNPVTLDTAEVAPLLLVDEVVLWNGNFAITGITNADSTQLLYPCYVYTGYNATISATGTRQAKIYPLTSEPATPFGGTIANPFAAGGTIGTGGSAATPSSGVTYRANEPVDVTIGAGTGQTITTKDNFGNTIDNAVATITHRLLLPGYSIVVTFTGVGATTVVQATCGNIQTFSGTAAAPSANVKYVVMKTLWITALAGGGTMTTLDGSTNTGGGTMDSAIAVPIYRYRLEPGQIVSFPVVPGTTTVVQQ